MSSKLGLIISMLFFTLFFLLGVDVMCIQYYYSDLDAKSVAISYNISKVGRSDSEFISSLEERYNVRISNISPENPEFGDMVEYIVEKDYKPIIVSSDVLVLKIKRTTVIGYFY